MCPGADRPPEQPTDRRPGQQPSRGQSRRRTRQVALTGVLFALAVVLGYLESFLTPLLGLPPGVKIGLANVVVMFALLFLSAPSALLLVLLKAGFGLITRGAVAGLLSLCGGLLSLGVMLLLTLVARRASVLLLSVAGALAHNAGQLLVIVWMFGSPAAWYYPVLALSGIAMGCLTAVLLRALLPALEKAGFGRAGKPPRPSGTPPGEGNQGTPADV